MDDLLHTFMKEEPWVEIYNGGSGLPWENKMRYEGKWISYGSPSYTERKAKELEPKVGGFIKHIKYSNKPVVLTKSSPKNSCALVVYCNNLARKDVRRILESHDIRVDGWVSNIYSLRNILNKPRFRVSMSFLNPDRLVEMGEIAGIDMRPEVKGAEALSAALLDRLKEYSEKPNLPEGHSQGQL